MTYEINTASLDAETNNCIEHAVFGNNSCVIKKGHKEIGAIISIDLFNLLKQIEKNFNDINSKFKKVGSKMTDQEIDDLVDEAVAYARQKEHARSN